MWGGGGGGGGGKGCFYINMAHKHSFTHMVVTDRDECSGVNDCHQLCINTNGSFECDCFEGFQLEPADNVTCTGKYSIHIHPLDMNCIWYVVTCN